MVDAARDYHPHVGRDAGEVADADHRIPDRMRGGRRFADRAQHEAPQRARLAVGGPPGAGHGQRAGVNHFTRLLVAPTRLLTSSTLCAPLAAVVMAVAADAYPGQHRGDRPHVPPRLFEDEVAPTVTPRL